MNEIIIKSIVDELKVTIDKGILYKLLFKVRTQVINDDDGVKNFLKCDGIKVLVQFLNKPYEKILEIVLSILGNCCLRADCGKQVRFLINLHEKILKACWIHD